MARTFNPQDAHVIINAVAKELTGQQPTIQAVDSSSFVSVGELIMEHEAESVLKAISTVIGRTMAAARPYEAKLHLITAMNSGVFSNRFRKLSFYARESQAAGNFNTQLFNENLKNGATNIGTDYATKDQWEQNQPQVLEMNFGGSSVWQDSTTRYEEQLQEAFVDEASFMAFVGGIMIEKANDLETQKEAFNRINLSNYMAGLYDLREKMPGSAINLTTEYNKKNGTQYTSAELRTTYLKDFLEFFVYRFNLESKRMAIRSSRYHWTPDRPGYALLRHTPLAKQRVLLYEPLILESKTKVLPEIFHEGALDLSQYESMLFWQNFTEGETSKLSYTPAIPDTNGSGAQKKGTPVALEYVVGLLYDEDALMTDFQLANVRTTPIEARKGYSNIWWSFKQNAINDFTENGILFYMDDSALPALAKKK